MTRPYTYILVRYKNSTHNADILFERIIGVWTIKYELLNYAARNYINQDDAFVIVSKCGNKITKFVINDWENRKIWKNNARSTEVVSK